MFGVKKCVHVLNVRHFLAGLSVSIDPGQYAYRKLMDLKELGIKPLVVLDGPHPDAKSQTVDKRKRLVMKIYISKF